MRKGFTLMELMIVIIIIGILATLGFVQYTRAVEKTRGAEAMQLLGSLRTQCAIKFMEDGNTTGCSNTWISGTMNLPQGSCSDRSHFRYTSNGPTGTADTVTFTAVRCASGGKSNGDSANNITMAINYTAGNETITKASVYQ